jgi:hypothetical protein
MFSRVAAELGGRSHPHDPADENDGQKSCKEPQRAQGSGISSKKRLRESGALELERPGERKEIEVVFEKKPWKRASSQLPTCAALHEKRKSPDLVGLNCRLKETSPQARENEEEKENRKRNSKMSGHRDILEWTADGCTDTILMSRFSQRICLQIICWQRHSAACYLLTGLAQAKNVASSQESLKSSGKTQAKDCPLAVLSAKI